MQSFRTPKTNLENPGIDPSASRMRIERSTIWANPPKKQGTTEEYNGFGDSPFHLTYSKNDLPDRESNPGLPRDRRGYSPLYYRGVYKVRNISR